MSVLSAGFGYDFDGDGSDFAWGFHSSVICILRGLCLDIPLGIDLAVMESGLVGSLRVLCFHLVKLSTPSLDE